MEIGRGNWSLSFSLYRRGFQMPTSQRDQRIKQDRPGEHHPSDASCLTPALITNLHHGDCRTWRLHVRLRHRAPHRSTCQGTRAGHFPSFPTFHLPREPHGILLKCSLNTSTKLFKNEGGNLVNRFLRT